MGPAWVQSPGHAAPVSPRRRSPHPSRSLRAAKARIPAGLPPRTRIPAGLSAPPQTASPPAPPPRHTPHPSRSLRPAKARIPAFLSAPPEARTQRRSLRALHPAATLEDEERDDAAQHDHEERERVAEGPVQLRH